jgi:hypothetical protein
MSITVENMSVQYHVCQSTLILYNVHDVWKLSAKNKIYHLIDSCAQVLLLQRRFVTESDVVCITIIAGVMC